MNQDRIDSLADGLEETFGEREKAFAKENMANGYLPMSEEDGAKYFFNKDTNRC